MLALVASKPASQLLFVNIAWINPQDLISVLLAIHYVMQGYS